MQKLSVQTDATCATCWLLNFQELGIPQQIGFTKKLNLLKYFSEMFWNEMLKSPDKWLDFDLQQAK